MSDIQAKFLGLHALALARVNAYAKLVSANMVEIERTETQLEMQRDDSLVYSDRHGQALREFLSLDRACDRLHLSRRFRLRSTKIEA